MSRQQFANFIVNLIDISEEEKDPKEIENLWRIFSKNNHEEITFEQFTRPFKPRRKKTLDLTAEEKKRKHKKSKR